MKARSLLVLAIVALNGCVHTSRTVQPRPRQEPGQPPSVQTSNTPKPFFLFAWINKVGRIIPHKAKTPVANVPQWLGSIRMVNEPEKFVLIESSAVASVIPGETYCAVGKGVETASLRMTNLKNPPFLIADIITGNPCKGDKIYLPQAARTPAPVQKPTPKPTAKPTVTPAPKAQPTPSTPVGKFPPTQQSLH